MTGGGPRAGRLPLAVVIVLAVGAFVFVVTAASARDARRASQPRRDRLAALIGERRARVEALGRTVGELRRRVSRLETGVAARSRDAAAELAALRRLEAAAGTTAVRGRGLEVRLRDSERAGGGTGDAGAYRIHDRDLQLVVNALVAAGAEAVSINDVRVVSTSPIRAAGDTIVVGFRPVAPPYVVRAVGARRPAFDASREARQFRRWERVFGLGFGVRAGDVEVPAFAGRVATGVARAGGV